MKDYKYSLSILIAAAIAVVIGLLTSCTMVTNYYIVYPTRVEQVKTYEYPSIDPGFYHPINNLPSFDDQIIDLRGWYPNTLEWHTVPGYTLNDLDLRFDTAQVPEEYYLLFYQDTTK